MAEVTSINPTWVGGTAGGDTITVSGSGFTDVTQVWFDVVAAASFTVDSDTQITAVTPAQQLTPSSKIGVTVDGPGGRSPAGDPDAAYLTLGAAPADSDVQHPVAESPVVSAINPTWVGGVAGGDSITVTGSGLTGATQVWFDVLPAASFTVDSDTQITAVTPVQPLTPSSKIAVLVDAPGGRSPAGDPDAAYLTLGAAPAGSGAADPGSGATPVVTSINPTWVGGVAGGDSITVTGSGLTGATQVWFDVLPAASFTVDSDTQITAVTPVQPLTESSKIAVLVDAPGGRSPAGDPDAAYLTLGAAPAGSDVQHPVAASPVVTSINPTWVGGVAGGDSITVTGSGLTGATQVWFDVLPAASFTVDSDTQITAVTPVQPLTPSSKIAVLVDAPGGRSPAGDPDAAYLTLGAAPA